MKAWKIWSHCFISAKNATESAKNITSRNESTRLFRAFLLVPFHSLKKRARYPLKEIPTAEQCTTKYDVWMIVTRDDVTMVGWKLKLDIRFRNSLDSTDSLFEFSGSTDESIILINSSPRLTFSDSLLEWNRLESTLIWRSMMNKICRTGNSISKNRETFLFKKEKKKLENVRRIRQCIAFYLRQLKLEWLVQLYFWLKLIGNRYMKRSCE